LSRLRHSQRGNVGVGTSSQLALVLMFPSTVECGTTCWERGQIGVDEIQHRHLATRIRYPCHSIQCPGKMLLACMAREMLSSCEEGERQLRQHHFLRRAHQCLLPP